MNRKEAYTALLKRHRPMIWRMCWLHAWGNWDRCCDLEQEVAIALWLHFDTLRPNVTPEEERAWVRWQSRNVIDHQLRKNRISTQLLTPEMAAAIPAENEQELQEELDDLMSSLSPDEQRMMRLQLEGYRADEIAELMGLQRDAVYKRLQRSVLKMRRFALLLLALLATTSLAIAVVPQWRPAFLLRTAEVDTVVESVEPQPAPVDTASVFAVDMEPEPQAVMRTPLPAIERMECNTLFPSLDETPPPLHIKPPITIAVNGRRLTISGLHGERVTLRHSSGLLVASQECFGISTFNLLPSSGSILKEHCYNLQIGDTLHFVLNL